MIAVALKWLSGSGENWDVRWAGVSLADEAALECALRLAEATADDVVAVSAGPPGATAGLRQALAAGAGRAILVEAAPHATSASVAAALAPVVSGARVVACGDLSADRSTGSVPAFLAAELGFAQALGLVQLASADEPDMLVGVRRLDGGRRERLQIPTPAVVSVEGSVARLRRAPLRATMAAADQAIEIVGGGTPADDEPVVTIHPYRPRPRVLAAPTGASSLDRVRSLLDAGPTSAAGETVVLDPPDAAVRLVRALVDWGYPP